MSETLPVLVVGAGPAGLTAAAELARRGVPVRLVDQADGPSPLTKALMVWPRTLEVFRLLGGAEAIERRGLPVDSFRYYSANRQICRIGFDPRTRPAVLVQPDVEELLRDSLTAAGGEVQWCTALTALEQDDAGVTAALTDPDGTTTRSRFSHVIGADGASSLVRKETGIDFQGATYPNVFILADVAVDGSLQRDAVHYYCSNNGVLVVVPLYNGRFRVFTAGPPGMRSADLTHELLQDFVDRRGPGGLRLHDVSWMTTFSIHARHAERLQEGRVFLAGDSAHVHSPAGGQGLNTGVTDAHNLAWKLALVHRGTAAPTLLDSYGVERSAVAAAVVRQAEVQTKAWMLSKRWQVLGRDVSAGLAQRLGLFDRYYSPWLAGLTNPYPAGPAIAAPSPGAVSRGAALRSGHLAPDGLRAQLPTDRYTLLVSLPDTAASRARQSTVEEIVAAHSDLLVVRVAHASGALGAGWTDSGPTPTPASATSPAGRRLRRPTIALIRPDHYVAAVDSAVGLPTLRAHLAHLTAAAVAVS